MSELVHLYRNKESVVALTVPCLVTAQSCLYSKKKEINEEDLFLVGQWDTGATKTIVSKNIIEALGIKPTGRKVNVCGVNGMYNSDTYLVDLHLPDGIVFENILVNEMIEEFGPSILIGLDVILRSDFILSPKDGGVLLKFRYPPEGDKPFTAKVIEFPDKEE